MDNMEMQLVVSEEQLERARALHGEPKADIGLSVFRATLLNARESVEDVAAAIALTELADYQHYKPEVVLKAIVQCRKTIGEGGAANLSAALQELMVTFDLK